MNGPKDQVHAQAYPLVPYHNLDISQKGSTIQNKIRANDRTLGERGHVVPPIFVLNKVCTKFL